MFKESLLQIGFSEKETRVYLELLRLGAQPVSTLSKRVKLHRGTVYDVIASLKDKGLVSETVAHRVKYYSANDPNSIVGYLDMQSQTLDYHKSEFLHKIPKLRSIMQEYAFKKPIVSHYDGISGVKRVMYDALTASSKYFYAYIALDKWFDLEMDGFLRDFKAFRIYKRSLPLRAVVADSPRARKFFDKNYREGDGMTEVLFIKSECNDFFEEEMNIYDDRVSILHLDKNEEYGVVIESSEIAAMQRQIFEMAWKGLEVNGEVKLY